MSSSFNATMFMSEQLNRLMVNAAQELAQRAVSECADRYNFDAMEAIRCLGLENIKVERKPSGKMVEKRMSKPKVVVQKPAFPLPFNGEFNDAYCYALRQNNGLYTQCQIARKGDKHYCKSCQALAEKSETGVPEYGTIQERLAVGIFEYVDPKGRKPVAYTKVMKKYKISQEQALEEAGKFSIIIDDKHFEVPEDTKRGRPSSQKEKTPKEPKGAKGRPKKAKKVLLLEGEGDDEDLFAALVADANEEDEEMQLAPKKKGKSDEEKEAERLAKEAEKALKEEQRLKEKAEKEAKLAAEKLEKEAKKEAERLARELKKAEEEAAKKAKEEQRLKDKAEKEAKLAAEKEAKKSKPAAKKAAEPVEDDGEPDVVKKIEFEGKKYLKSKKTGIIYDYNEYVKNSEQVVVGHWNESKNKIDFSDAGEESEEEYEN
jgi:chemotaxis protein histidine kinase CheA